MPKGSHKVVANNRKAYHDYFLEDPTEAGIVLTGSEIKSIRDNRVNLRDGYVLVEGAEMWLVNVHISGYDQASVFDHDPLRRRKLLMHRREINKMGAKVRERGYSIVPIQLYLNEDGRVKVEIALAKGKKNYDKRDAMAERDNKRDIARALKERD
jgi:SsrA-binding protein